MPRFDDAPRALAHWRGRLRSRVAVTVRTALYRGERLTCPCCASSFSRFVTHRGRADVRCPRCGSMERHRVLALWMGDQPWLRASGLRILHIAPERALAPLLKGLPGARYRSGDIDSPFADDRVDVMDLPYADASFDLIVCNHVLEHVENDMRAMRELHRVLAPEGHAILMVPIGHDRTETLEDAAVTTPADRLATFGQEDHARLYGTDYLDRLERAGFRVTSERPADAMSAEIVARHRLVAEHPIFDENDVIWAVPGSTGAPASVSTLQAGGEVS